MPVQVTREEEASRRGKGKDKEEAQGRRHGRVRLARGAAASQATGPQEYPRRGGALCAVRCLVVPRGAARGLGFLFFDFRFRFPPDSPQVTQALGQGTTTSNYRKRGR
jgi:hypothetical protein